jgi:hypothetical protein
VPVGHQDTRSERRPRVARGGEHREREASARTQHATRFRQRTRGARHQHVAPPTNHAVDAGICQRHLLGIQHEVLDVPEAELAADPARQPDHLRGEVGHDHVAVVAKDSSDEKPDLPRATRELEDRLSRAWSETCHERISDRAPGLGDGASMRVPPNGHRVPDRAAPLTKRRDVHQDAKVRTWDDLPWAEHPVTLRYSLRRLWCRSGGIRTERVAFADPHARLTRPFRQRIGLDCQSMPTSHAAVRHAVSWGTARRAERAFLHAWDRSRPKRRATHLGVDEIQRGKGLTIKAVLRRARGMRDEAMLVLKLTRATARPIRSARDVVRFLHPEGVHSLREGWAQNRAQSRRAS